MALKLHYWPSLILSEVSTPYSLDEASTLESLGKDMIALAIANNGIGLAANQVGINRRIFVARMKNKEWEIFVNPELVDASPQELFEYEGCLSLPQITGQLSRPVEVDLKWYDPSSKTSREAVFLNLESRCVQHELDHLNGIMFFDKSHIERNQRRQILKNWDKIKENYVVE